MVRCISAGLRCEKHFEKTREFSGASDWKSEDRNPRPERSPNFRNPIGARQSAAGPMKGPRAAGDLVCPSAQERLHAGDAQVGKSEICAPAFGTTGQEASQKTALVIETHSRQRYVRASSPIPLLQRRRGSPNHLPRAIRRESLC